MPERLVLVTFNYLRTSFFFYVSAENRDENVQRKEVFAEQYLLTHDVQVSAYYYTFFHFLAHKS